MSEKGEGIEKNKLPAITQSGGCKGQQRACSQHYGNDCVGRQADHFTL